MKTTREIIVIAAIVLIATGSSIYSPDTASGMNPGASIAKGKKEIASVLQSAGRSIMEYEQHLAAQLKNEHPYTDMVELKIQIDSVVDDILSDKKNVQHSVAADLNSVFIQ